jgi:CHAD domain-containing protein
VKEIKKKTAAWNGEETPEWNARTVLPVLAAEYFEAGRKVQDPACTADDLHGFRLTSKRFRYTLELFRDLYGPGFEKYIQGIKDLQDQLGQISDCDTARSLLTPHMKRFPLARRKLDAFLDSRCTASTTRFRELWRTVFDAAGRERKFVTFLKRPLASKKQKVERKNVRRSRPRAPAQSVAS